MEHERRVAQRNEALSEQVKSFVKANLSPALTVKEIAEVMKMHPSDLDRAFRRVTQTTVKKYIDAKCREKIEECMKAGDWKGSQLAMEFGFPTDQALYRWIKRVFGTSLKDLQSLYCTRGSQKRYR